MADWLPPLCLFADHGNEWERYEAFLYSRFRRDFIVSPPRIDGTAVLVNVAPVVNGKEESFWHLVTEEEVIVREGKELRERVPNFRRCERIAWPGAILREGESDRVRVWREQRHDGRRIIFALADFSYLVALAVRAHGKLYLATAFPLDEAGRRTRLRKQYERSRREQFP